MNYNEIKTLLTSLGWESKDWFNGRELYCLKDAPDYQVFEHMNEIGVVNPYDEELELIYCNMTANELKESTRNLLRQYFQPAAYEAFLSHTVDMDGKRIEI